MQLERDIAFIPQTKWNSITNWLTDKQYEEESRERAESYPKNLKERSSQVVAGNDSKKVAAAKRKDEKKLLSEGKDQKVLLDYLRIRENQKIERKKIMEKYQKYNVLNKTPTFELTCALKEAQVLVERQNELEFRQELRRIEKDMKDKEKEELKRQWNITNILSRQEEEARRSQLNAIKTEVWKQCQDNRQKKNEEYKNQVKQERMDLLKINEELETMERLKEEQRQYGRRKTLVFMKKAAEEAGQNRFINNKKDKELYRVNEVINNALAVRDCHIKSKLKEEIKERIEKNEVSYIRYVSQIPHVGPTDETIHQNGVLENQEFTNVYGTEEEPLEGTYEKKIREKRDLRKKYAEAKIQDYEEDMRWKKIKQAEEAKMEHMEMIERYKKIEAMQYLEDIKQKDENEQKTTYGKELLNQAEEYKNNAIHEKKLEDEYVFYAFSKQDDGFAEYADEVIKFAEMKKWPTMPIRKVIENYKKSTHTAKKTKRNTFWKRADSIDDSK